MKAKIIDKEENKRYGISRNNRRDVVGCVLDVVGKGNLLVKFEDRHKSKRDY